MNDFEEARYLAAGIEGARLVALETDNHIILEDEDAWAVYCSELRQFLAPELETADSRPAGSVNRTADRAGANGHAAALDLLSPREVEILHLAAQGLDNDAIAQALTLSVRTVERHLSNVYAKLDLHGKSARTAAVARLLTRA